MASSPIIPADTQRVFIGIPVDKSSQKRINALLKPVKHSSRPASPIAPVGAAPSRRFPVGTSSRPASPIAPTGELPTLQDVRWVPEENRHLTLAFLGDKPVSEVSSLLELFDQRPHEVP